MADRVLQRVVLPPRRGLTRLYCRFDRSPERPDFRPKLRGRRTLILPPGSFLRTDTWFNAFFESYWRQYTFLSDLSLRFAVSGRGVLRFYRRSRNQKRSLLRELEFSGMNRELCIEVEDKPTTFDDLGILFFEIESRSQPVTLHLAEWISQDVKTRPVRIAAAYCTCNRASQLLDNVASLFSDPDVGELLDRVIVVDQGQKKVRDHPAYESLLEATDSRLHLIEQDNFGGAGGFTRCLLEATNAASPTHVVLMDDDAFVEPEAIFRTAAFFSLARAELAVGGAMLDASRQRELVEPGCRYLPEQLRINEPRRTRVDRPKDLMPFLQPQHVHYNGWWFLAFPLTVLDRVGLPLPLFLRGDDLEFGCRLLRKGVPTVALPGVTVWHEPFEHKGRGWHPFYELRNFLIVGALYFPRLHAATVARRFFSRLLDELLAYDYYESWLLCEAVRAYLSGPATLRDPPLSVHRSLTEMQAKLAPMMQECDRTPRAPLRRPPMLRSPFLHLRRLRLVLRNLLRRSLPLDAQPSAVLHGPGEQWYDIGAADVIGVADSPREQIVILRRCRGQFVRLLLRGGWLTLKLLFCHRGAVRRWSAEAPHLINQRFWKSYLRLPAASAIREEVLCVRD